MEGYYKFFFFVTYLQLQRKKAVVFRYYISWPTFFITSLFSRPPPFPKNDLCLKKYPRDNTASQFKSLITTSLHSENKTITFDSIYIQYWLFFYLLTSLIINFAVFFRVGNEWKRNSKSRLNKGCAHPTSSLKCAT